MRDNQIFGIKVVAALLAVTMLIFGFSFARQDPEEKIVQEQLEAIRDKRFTEAYYTFTSKAFQESSSLENFKKFISNFPLFTQDAIRTIEIQKKPGEVKVTLSSGNEEMHLLYTLTQKDNEWLVRGIEITNEEHVMKDVPEFDSTIFIAPIKQQMEAFKEKDFQKAYQTFTSEDFKNTTSFEEFKTFVDSFPIFINFDKVDYSKLSFNNNLGVYDVKLVDQEGKIYELQYDLIKENGVWKILQIQIQNPPL